ncbi:MAG: EamA family transporter [Caldimicrobium sp.]|nr:EamA family transporter [Caldimicrobium sp.]MCX7873522.1 EamA family transporter [Caldimicrobium sp.]MDW8094699.1 EamA family transporter [Caldimicrobium sp.]
MDQKTLLLWIATVFFWGISPILEKIGLKNVDPLIGLCIRTISALIAVVLFILFTGQLEKFKFLNYKDIFYLSLSGITAGFLGMLFYFSLLKTHYASQAVPLTATYPLVVTFLAMIFLKEPITSSKLIGTLLIVLGIYLLFRGE